MKDILGQFLLLLLVSATAKAENYNYENRDASPDKTSQGDSTGKSSKKSSQGLVNIYFRVGDREVSG